MFDYPIPLPRNTRYDQLGIRPEASDEDLGEARDQLVDRLKLEKVGVEKSVRVVFDCAEGLEETYAALDALLASPEDPDPAELAKTQDRLASLEKDALERHPQLRQDRNRAKELAEQINEWNTLPITKPDKRSEYDRETPPLEVLKLEDCKAHGLSNDRNVISLVRREVTTLLGERGGLPFRCSDLETGDFRDDFTANPLLDEGVDDG